MRQFQFVHTSFDEEAGLTHGSCLTLSFTPVRGTPSAAGQLKCKVAGRTRLTCHQLPWEESCAKEEAAMTASQGMVSLKWGGLPLSMSSRSFPHLSDRTTKSAAAMVPQFPGKSLRGS